MKKIRKNPVFCFCMFLAGVISLVFAIWISSVKPANAAVNNTSGVLETTGVRYDYVYVSGTRYIVFTGPSGDIEVVR